jgi:cell wall-associated NlpC family hydrolase
MVFRVLLLASGLALYAGLLLRVKSRKRVFGVFLVLPLAVAFFWTLPGIHRIPREALRRDYLQAVKQFKGSRYLWGGENRVGIDCSGLPRASLRKAMLANGFKTANGYLLRAAVANWWFDASAEAMLNCYRNETLPIGASLSIAEYDHSALEPGDLAITDGGIHCLVYVGNRQWIQADPSATRVIEVNAGDRDNYWLGHSVEFVRWQYFVGNDILPDSVSE